MIASSPTPSRGAEITAQTTKELLQKIEAEGMVEITFEGRTLTLPSGYFRAKEVRGTVVIEVNYRNTSGDLCSFCLEVKGDSIIMNSFIPCTIRTT